MVKDDSRVEHSSVTRPANYYALWGALLFLAACGAGMIGFVEGLGGALCDNQPPEACQAQQNNDTPWWIAAAALALSAIAMFIRSGLAALRDRTSRE